MNRKARRGIPVPHVILRLLFTGQLKERPCTHRDLIRHVTPAVDVCRDCVSTGDTWPALRMCLICGYVGCCDQAKNRHARKHFEATGHPLMRSIEPGEDWVWCYVDEAMLSLPRET